ncbi:MAG: urease accessory UreF family protein [Opitutales bacterium]|nr:urease accessory UreF family protein [Opitutales bacterium]
MNSGDSSHEEHWVASLLQVSDPLFPTGAYAHSMGLEQWANTCGLKTGDDLAAFFKDHAGPSLARLELPYLRFARNCIKGNELSKLASLEQEIDAWKWASEIREASTTQGRGRLRLFNKLWPDQRVDTYRQLLADGKLFGHHLAVTALQFEILKVPEEAGLMAYGYQSLANYVSASIKLLRIGPESAQSVLHDGLDQLPDWVDQSLTVGREDAGWFAPAFDISCAQHATAFSRLFIS